MATVQATPFTLRDRRRLEGSEQRRASTSITCKGLLPLLCLQKIRGGNRTPKIRVGAVGAGQQVAGFCLNSEGGADGLEGDTVVRVGGAHCTPKFGPEAIAGVTHEGRQVSAKTTLKVFL